MDGSEAYNQTPDCISFITPRVESLYAARDRYSRGTPFLNLYYAARDCTTPPA
ncbi:hypothetical protein L195_g063533, partial [Trifolium pratense]